MNIRPSINDFRSHQHFTKYQHMLTKYIISEEHCVCSKGTQGLPQDYYDVLPLSYPYATLHRLNQCSTNIIIWLSLSCIGKYTEAAANKRRRIAHNSISNYNTWQDGSKNGENTMEALDPLYQSTMGQRTGMSFFDAMIVNRAYCQCT